MDREAPEVPLKLQRRSMAMTNESANMDPHHKLSFNMNRVAEEGNQQEQQKQVSTNGNTKEETTQTIIHGHQFSQRDFEEHFYSKTFEGLVSAVDSAIRRGVMPELIKQGTSGSYFCRSNEAEIVAVFKPKSEEPYGPANPKMGKKIQRMFCPCMFGRGCLLNNQGYLSEAGAFIVNEKLQLGVVPLTSVAWISSDSFNYSKSTRNKALMKSEINKRYPAIGAKFHRLGLKPKIGSMQQFVKNYKDANVFLNETNNLRLLEEDDHRDFLEQFQRMVVLDYVIRNTDRGPSNWLIKSEAVLLAKARVKNVNTHYGFNEENEEDGEEEEKGQTAVVMHPGLNINNNADAECSDPLFINDSDEGYRTSTEGKGRPNVTNNAQRLDLEGLGRTTEQVGAHHQRQSGFERTGSTDSLELIPRMGDDWNGNAYTGPKRILLAAIDNGLAFPFKHPDDWRGYPFHWAGYSFAKIPFFDDLKTSLVSKLGDMTFVEELVEDLHGLFSLDRDFTIEKFDEQMGVMRGQILNLTQALKEGKSPAELVQMDSLSVERRYTIGKRSLSAHGSGRVSFQPRTSIQPHNLGEGYSFTNHKKKPKCGCCW